MGLIHRHAPYSLLFNFFTVTTAASHSCDTTLPSPLLCSSVPQGQCSVTHRSKGMYRGAPTLREFFETIEMKPFT